MRVGEYLPASLATAEKLAILGKVAQGRNLSGFSDRQEQFVRTDRLRDDADRLCSDAVTERKQAEEEAAGEHAWRFGSCRAGPCASAESRWRPDARSSPTWHAD